MEPTSVVFVGFQRLVTGDDGNDAVLDEPVSEHNDRAYPAADNAAEDGGTARHGNAAWRRWTNESVAPSSSAHGHASVAKRCHDAHESVDDGPSVDGYGRSWSRDEPIQHDAEHAPRTHGDDSGSLHAAGLQHHAPHAAASDERTHKPGRHSSRPTDHGRRDAPHEPAHGSISPHAIADGFAEHGRSSEPDDAPGADGGRGICHPEQHDGSTSARATRDDDDGLAAPDADGRTANSAGTARVHDASTAAANIPSTATTPTA